MQPVTLISGATAGMGRRTALLLARRGHRVFAGARREDAARELHQSATAEGLEIETVPLDVTDRVSVNQAVENVLSRASRIDNLVNNAGFGLLATVEEGSDDEFIRQFDVNVFGVLRLCRAVLPAMRAQGSGVIVNISSFLGRMGLPLLTHYNASKYAVEGITDSLRHEVRPFGTGTRPGACQSGHRPLARPGLAGLSPHPGPEHGVQRPVSADRHRSYP